MEEKLIEFKTAKLAKKKGFILHTLDTFYQYDGSISLCHYKSKRALYVQDMERVECYAPTQALLQKWLRDVHKLTMNIHPVENGKWEFVIFILKKPLPERGFENIMSLHVEPYRWDTYEEALERALKEALKLI